jgi:hypothetical protein
MRKYILGIALLAALVIGGGCVFIDYVIMPETAYQYSSFHVTIYTHAEAVADVYGILGVLVPVGWEPTDVLYSGSDSEGDMIYDSDVSVYIDSIFPAPEGYGWWGYLTDQSIQTETGDEYIVDFDVLTDGQLGTFFLDFAVGYLVDGATNVTDLSEDNEIEIIEDQVEVKTSSFGAVKAVYAE